MNDSDDKDKGKDRGAPVSLDELLASSGAAASGGPAPASVEEIKHLFQLVRRANLYRIMNVGPSADQRQLKDSYFALMSKFHPDLYYGNPDRQLAEAVDLIYKRVTISYEILGDAESRKAYDLFLEGKLPRPTRFTRLEFINALRQAKRKPLDESELEFQDIISSED